MQKSIVLLSGGLDSSTIVADFLAKGIEVSAVAIDYGQNHRLELACAKRLAQHYDVKLDILEIPTFLTASSLLSGKDIPKGRTLEEISNSGVPSTFVPGRNLLFASMASAYAATRGVKYVALGVNKDDYTGYPDCRPAFIEAFQETLDNAFPKESRVELITPLIEMTKVEIVRLAIRLQLPLNMTSSCYSPIEDRACQQCDACVLRAHAISFA